MAKKRNCECCGVEYFPTSSAQKYCVSCRMVYAQLALSNRKNKKKKRPILKPTAKKNEK